MRFTSLIPVLGLAALFTGATVLTGCDEGGVEEATEETGETIEEGAEETGETIEEGAEETEEVVE